MRSASTDVMAWYAASLGNNYATPALLDIISSPLTLNLIEQATMALVALVVLPAVQLAPLPSLSTIRKSGPSSILCMGLSNALTCRLFMISLKHLDVSLCHTIRACNPCCAAMIAMLNGQKLSSRRLCSLPLMLVGFAIAVAAEPSCSMLGVAAGIGSLISLSALQHLTHYLTFEKGLPEMQVQMLQCSLCFVLLLPGLLSRGRAQDLRDALIQSRKFQWLSLLNGASDYAENVAATAACASFAPVDFAVLDMLRRLIVIIGCGMGARKNPAGMANVAGTLLVLAGALLYARSGNTDDCQSAK